MSVEVIIGRAGTGKTFALLERMKKILRESPISTKIIFLLPAYQTYRAELELAAMTGGAINTAMWSFQRFARQILSEIGGASVPRISDIGRRIILRKILKHNAKDLLYYRKAADQRGFTEILAKELQELGTYSIDAVKLRQLIDADKNIDDELKNKLHDIALLSEKFRAEIENRQNDESDLIEKAAELLKDAESIKHAEIFIDGFIFFDPQQRKLVSEIIRHAKNVYIALPMDVDLNSRENVKELGMFNRAFQTFKTIRDFAEKVHAEFKITRLSTPRRFESPELKYVEQNLFSRSYKKFSGKCENLKIVETVNKRVEVEAAARDILRLHREKNIRFRDIGVIFRDESYNSLIKPVFEIHNIPFFVDRKRAATNHPFAELIRSALEVLRTWRSEPIFRCLRTGFFDVSQEEVDVLENYVLEFGLRGKKIWTQGDTWHWYRRRLDDVEPAQTEIARAGNVDAIRRRAVEPLIKFSASVDKIKKSAPRKNKNADKIKNADEIFIEGNTREFAKTLFEFVESLKIHDKLADLSELEESRGNLAPAMEHLKIWDDIVKLTEQIVDSADEELISLKDFDYIVNEGLDALEMSIIPPGIDEVTVAQFDQNSLQNAKAIYVLGFGDENFPSKVSEKLLLTDADRLHLNDAGLEISKGGNESMLAEKFLIYRGLTSAKNFLYISYPLANAEGSAMYPSPLVERFKTLFDVKIDLIKIDVLDNLGTQINFALVESTSKLQDKTAQELYAAKNKMSGSVTRFEKFNKCPFQYFAEYGLKLEQRREYKLTTPDVGTILHEILRQFGEDLKAENKRWSEVTDDEIKSRVTKIFDNITPKFNNEILLSTKTLKNQRTRIQKVAVASIRRLVELDSHSKFHPEIFEASFSSLSNTHLVYKIDETQMELFGKIDRIDFSEDGRHFLIIDYKTGQAYLNLWEIYLGINLQLLTYLMVTNNLENVGERLPAAMLYYFLKYPVKTGNSVEDAENKIANDLKMSGYILADEEVVREIDSTLKTLKVTAKDDGTIYSRSRENPLKDVDTFKLLMNYAEECLKATGKKILSGNIAADPVKTKNQDACKYCAYYEVCRLDRRFDVKVRTPLDDNAILENMREVTTS